MAACFSLILYSAYSQSPPGLYGFASIAAHGVSTTTGGAGGREVYVNGQGDAQLFSDYLKSSEPLIIYVSGTIQLPENPDFAVGSDPRPEEAHLRMNNIKSDKTIIGQGSGATITQSGFSIYGGTTDPGLEPNLGPDGVHNIII